MLILDNEFFTYILDGISVVSISIVISIYTNWAYIGLFQT